jgi:hypothetical protein
MSLAAPASDMSFYISSLPTWFDEEFVKHLFQANRIGVVKRVDFVHYICKYTHETKHSAFVHLDSFLERSDIFREAVRKRIYGKNRIYYQLAEIGLRKYWYVVVKPYTSRKNTSCDVATYMTNNNSVNTPNTKINIWQPANIEDRTETDTETNKYSSPRSSQTNETLYEISDISSKFEDMNAYDDCATSIQEYTLSTTEKSQLDKVLPSPPESEEVLIHDAEISNNKFTRQLVPSGHTLRMRTSKAQVEVFVSASLNTNPRNKDELPIVLSTQCIVHEENRPPSPLHAPPSHCFY